MLLKARHNYRGILAAHFMQTFAFEKHLRPMDGKTRMLILNEANPIVW